MNHRTSKVRLTRLESALGCALIEGPDDVQSLLNGLVTDQNGITKFIAALQRLATMGLVVLRRSTRAPNGDAITPLTAEEVDLLPSAAMHIRKVSGQRWNVDQEAMSQTLDPWIALTREGEVWFQGHANDG